ncbi:putative cyclin-dependent serine/threonine-protein kinase DDB_G0272797/DDB_G0274007 [Macrobrachium rosenbergii]|uniref:putative cyclin-dependent serine/threonine-protein kinase DDB_G0272797/DDB_G0274007 n=1 Tax=Macrobrachium rosenbergii TaxID=79674 RepID=UPI0034D53839
MKGLPQTQQHQQQLPQRQPHQQQLPHRQPHQQQLLPLRQQHQQQLPLRQPHQQQLPLQQPYQQQLPHQQPQQQAPPTRPPQQHTHNATQQMQQPQQQTAPTHQPKQHRQQHKTLPPPPPINKRDPRLKEHRHQDARVDTQTPSTNPTPFSTYNTPVTKTPLLPNPTPFSTINPPSRKTPLLTLPPTPTTAPSSSHPNHSTPESPSKRNAVSITREEFRREVARVVEAVIAQLFPGVDYTATLRNTVAALL